MSVTRGQCDARPAFTFPAARQHRSLASTKVYCLVTEAHMCQQLALDSGEAGIGTFALPKNCVELESKLTRIEF